MRTMYIITVLILMTCFASVAQVSKGLKDNPAIKRLKIGDTVPDLLISKIINSKVRKMKISDFKESLLILDFWDTGCSSCIEALPRMDRLQKQFGNQIKVLPITWQGEKLLSKFFKENRYVKEVSLPCVVEDRLLRNYFKHRSISHIVWIYKGIVKAITGASYVTASNIQDILNSKNINWPVKYESLDYDYDQPLMKGEAKQYAAIMSYKKDLERKTGETRDSIRKTVRNYMINFPIIYLYNLAIYKMKSVPFSTSPKHVILEVKDRSKYFYDPQNGPEEEWIRENSLCYESLLPDTLTEAEQGKRMVADLDRLLNLRGRVEYRKVPCLVLVRRGKGNIETGKEQNPAKGMFRVVMSLNMAHKYPPVIDETGFKGELPLKGWTNLDELRLALQEKGFDVLEEVRYREVFVLTEVG